MVGRRAKSASCSKILYFEHSRHFMASLVTMEIFLVRPYILSFTVPVDEDIGLRFLLGFAEAGLYPGIVFYLSWWVCCTPAKRIPSDVFTVNSWYKRSELGSRIAVVYSAASIAGAFSVYITLSHGKLTDYFKQCQSGAFLAVAIHNMDGIGGRPGWAWIFILEGLFTILVACASPWVLQDFPESAKFLSEVERMCTTTPT